MGIIQSPILQSVPGEVVDTTLANIFNPRTCFRKRETNTDMWASDIQRLWPGRPVPQTEQTRYNDLQR